MCFFQFEYQFSLFLKGRHHILVKSFPFVSESVAVFGISIFTDFQTAALTCNLQDLLIKNELLSLHKTMQYVISLHLHLHQVTKTVATTVHPAAINFYIHSFPFPFPSTPLPLASARMRISDYIMLAVTSPLPLNPQISMQIPNFVVMYTS